MPIAPLKPKSTQSALAALKTQSNSEEMLGVLAADGYWIDAGAGNADVVVINTCGFINSAKQESIDTIWRRASAKKRERSAK